MSTAVATPHAGGPGRAAQLWAALAVPLAFFLVAEAIVLLTAISTQSPVLQATTYAHWDSKYYLQIASRGYYLASCDGVEGPIGATCGNAAWFPAIGWLTGLLTAFGGPQVAVMLLLARAFALGTLVLAYNGLLDRRRDVPALAALAFVAFAPGSVYFHAVFPVSMATCAIVGTLVLLRRERWGWAALCGAVAATTYTTVVLIAPVIVVWLLLRRDWSLGRRIGRAALVGGGTALGAAVVVVVMWRQTGALDAFSQVQSKYAYQTGFPTRFLFDRIGSIGEGTGIGPVLGLQAIYVSLVVLLCAGWWALRERRWGLELLAVLLGLVLWLVPLYLAQSSLQRSDALLVPLAIVIARLPRALAVTVAIGALLLVAPLATFYITGSLI